jgi:hypothetical protein
MNLKTLIATVVAFASSLVSTPKPSIDGIVANINTQVAALNTAAQAHRDEALIQYAESERLEDAGDANVDEACRAARIASRLSQLVG